MSASQLQAMAQSQFSTFLSRITPAVALLSRQVSRLPARARLLIVIPAIFFPLLLLLHLSFSDTTVAFLGRLKPPPPQPSTLFPDRPDVPNPPTNITYWGERGARVRKLAEWADLLTPNSTQDEVTLFEAHIITQFPHLAGALGSLYRPWSLDHEPPDSPLADRGHSLVICAGSGNYYLAAHLIRSLRRVHGSSTLIEVAYAGTDDLQPKHRAFLANLGANIEFIDVLQRFPAARWDLVKSGWAMKPFALLAAARPRAILIDADALFLISPDSLFDEHPGLRKTGTLFFHDRAAIGGDDDRRNWVKDQIAAAGIEPSHYLANESLFYAGATWYEQDSGVVAVDRTNPRALLGLMFTTWMNTKDVRDEVTYKVFYGDKESFWVAMELCGFEYTFQPWYAGTMGTITDEENVDLAQPTEICGTHMLHLDHHGETPFWINGGVYEHKGEREKGYARMTHYWVGNTSSIRETQPNWYWHAGNVACLKETGVKELPDVVRKNARKNNEQAEEVDNTIKHLQLD